MEIKSKILNFMEILMISKIKTVLNFKITIIKINLIMIVVHGFNDSYNIYNISYLICYINYINFNFNHNKIYNYIIYISLMHYMNN